MLDNKQIEHLAKLAKLDVTEEEKSKYAEQISAVLDYFEQIRSLEVQNINELEHITGMANVVRYDEERNVSLTEDIMDQAPEISNQQFRVSEVFNRE